MRLVHRGGNRMFNKGLTRGAGAVSKAKKKSHGKRGSQEFNREASNEVVQPLGKNPADWMGTVMTHKA
jgi:hypothetical protein